MSSPSCTPDLLKTTFKGWRVYQFHHTGIFALLLELKQIERTPKGLGKPLKHPNSLGSSNTQMLDRLPENLLEKAGSSKNGVGVLLRLLNRGEGGSDVALLLLRVPKDFFTLLE